MKEFRAGPDAQGQRLDVFISQKYPAFSRSSLDNLFERESVLVNSSAFKAGHKLKTGDRVSVDDALLFKQPPKIELPILYEDDDVLVIDKPAGVLTHSKGALNLEATVASFIKDKITDDKLTGNRAGIVHRLDRGTSGLIIAAKTAKALQGLQKQFSARKVKKTYIAVAEGAMEPAEALIEAPIARNPKRPQTFTVSAAGKPAATQYKVLKNFQKDGKTYSLVELRPLTGRTHQLRVHLAYIGHPIAGDHHYGRDDGQMLLHAKLLELTLPNHKRRLFEAKIPEHFKEFTDNG